MKTTIFALLRPIAMVGLLFPLASYATAFTPASFGNAADTLKKSVNLPSSFGEGVTAVAVYCQADVMTSGNVNQVACYENSPLVSMQALTESALQSATFSPASVDGKNVPVRMQFRVVYSLNSAQPVTLLPNLGTLQAQYGANYVAPQERLDQGSWYVAYSNEHRGTGKPFFADAKLTRVMATIEVNGGVESVSTIEAALRKQGDADDIQAALKKSQFIPGFVADKPTAMHYIAVVNYKK